MPSPAIVLAFANDWVDDKRHLRNLPRESKAIDKALAPLVEAGKLGMSSIHNATVDDVMGTFRKPRYRDRIRVFHFGGHASGSTLLFEDDAGHPTEAHASGLAGFLGQQRGLVLVFLNGCCTEPQVRRLRAAGIKAVVATTRAIHDEVAAEFATAFYAELAARSLQDAFDAAVHAIRMRRGNDPREITRDIALHEVPAPPPWPWIIDCDPDFKAWSLGSELARRTRLRRLLFAMSSIALLLITSLVLSAGARRTACRAPGLRVLCAAAGIGNVPTPAEQTLWDRALAQSSGDGLRAYLRTYPEGAYADEARSRLAGCWTERVETLDTAKDVRHALTVNPIRANPLPTEKEARRNALARGNQDAADFCESYRMKADLLSASAEPRDWKCTEVDHGFACGFDGAIVCRVRYRIQSDRERCHDEHVDRRSSSMSSASAATIIAVVASHSAHQLLVP